MITETLNGLAARIRQAAPHKSSFSALAVLAGAALGGFLGGLIALIAMSFAGTEWSLRLVLALQIALNFAIMGAWIAVSFTQDDCDDVPKTTPPPTQRVALPNFVKPTDLPRIAA